MIASQLPPSIATTEQSMTDPIKFHLVDDDDDFLDLVEALLRDAGHDVSRSDDPRTAIDDVLRERPTCVLLDIMMPGVSGLDLCMHMRSADQLGGLRIIVVSAKTYEFDRVRARQLGADGYITKPIAPENFLDQLTAAIADDITLTFWGVRGTLPVPGEETNRYSGNTSCVTLSLPRERLFIFDAGTGIKKLSDHLMKSGASRIEGAIFLSHPHWDHINSLPFFIPLYVPGNSFDIYGADHGDTGVRDLVSAQMDGVYFPVTTREFGANVGYHTLNEGDHEIDGVVVKTMYLSYPGNCLGYRVIHGDRSFCYITDNELYPPNSTSHNPAYNKQLTEFVAGCDVLVTDCTYTAEEYATKEGWGHSAIEEVVKIVRDAEVKNFCLFHHDPDQLDDDIAGKLELARRLLADYGATTNCIAPRERETLTI